MNRYGSTAAHGAGLDSDLAHTRRERDAARAELAALQQRIEALCDRADADLSDDTCHRVWTANLRIALRAALAGTDAAEVRAVGVVRGAPQPDEALIDTNELREWFASDGRPSQAADEIDRLRADLAALQLKLAWEVAEAQHQYEEAQDARADATALRAHFKSVAEAIKGYLPPEEAPTLMLDLAEYASSHRESVKSLTAELAALRDRIEMRCDEWLHVAEFLLPPDRAAILDCVHDLRAALAGEKK